MFAGESKTYILVIGGGCTGTIPEEKYAVAKKE